MSAFGMRKRDLFKQFSKFASVGVPAFFIDYGLMVFFTEVFGISYMISATTSFLVSIVFQYFASMRFVFKRKESMKRSRAFAIFLLVSAASLVLNDILMWVTSTIMAFDYRLSKLAVATVVSFFSFGSRKYLLEGRPA